MKVPSAIIIFATLGLLTASAQTRVEAESKVLALERLWGEAAQLRDIRALESIFDDNLIYVHIDGRLMTKAEVLADTKELDPVEIVVDSSVARAHGQVVVVTGVLHLKYMGAGKPRVQYGRYFDAWVLNRDHWVCVSSMTTPMRR